MKKIVLRTLALSALLICQGQAVTEGGYIGLDAGNTEATLSATIGASSISEKDDGTSATLKFGYQYEDGGRVYAAAQYIDAEDADFMLYGLGYDYLFGDAIVKPFVGGFVGYGQYQTDRSSLVDLDISGVIYGAQAGLNFEATDRLQIEAGYRYLKSNMSDSVGGVAFDIDELKNWFVGFNYKF